MMQHVRPTLGRTRVGWFHTRSSWALSILAVFLSSEPARCQPPITSQPGDVDRLLDALPVDPAAVRATRRLVGSEARQAESAHFVVLHTARDDVADALLGRLEVVYRAHARFARELKLPARRPRYKLQVVLFGQCAEFARYARSLAGQAADSLGFYDYQDNRSVFFDLDTHPDVARLRALAQQSDAARRPESSRRLDVRRAALARSIVQHEAAHHIQASLGLVPATGNAPRWLVEGLAMLFEVPLDDAGRPRGPINGYRLFEFRKLYGGGSDTLADLPRLLSDDQAWCGGECYPLAWAVTRYLYDRQRAAFAALLRKVASGEELPAGVAERRALLQELFGPMDAAWLERFHAEVMRWPLDRTAFCE